MEETVLTSTFMRIRERLRSLAASITGSGDEADDALHDAFCKLWSAYPRLDSERDAARLSYTAVRNSALDLRRYQLAHPKEGAEGLSETLTQTAEDEERKELYDTLMVMASRVLNEMQYKVFEMHDVEGLPYAEIAETLGITQVNVRQLLSRARKTIREEYRKISH